MSTFKALVTEEKAEGFVNTIQQLDMSILEKGEVVVAVSYSGINYKDYLSSKGNKGITRNYPHVPGIDVSGTVVSDKTNTFAKGEEVLVMGYDLGMNTDGGFAEYIAVPAAWVMRKPAKFTCKEAMILGTSAFTAALGIRKMLQMGQAPEQGAVVVSGATGGVGLWAVQLLVKLGFEVWAITGKASAASMLESLGVAKVFAREEAMGVAEKPLLRPRWAGAFDAVGGETLVSLLKQTSKSGSVATCGNVGGMGLSMTVFPFILNGVNLLGINAADTPMKERIAIWDFMEQIIEPSMLENKGELITLEEVPAALEQMGQSTHTGRFAIQIG